MIQAEQGLQMFMENWYYSEKLSLKGWRLANTGQVLKQQYFPFKTCAGTHTQAHSEKL